MAETTNAKMNQNVKATLEMKQRAVKYYNDNGVPKCLESLLNSMFLDEPDDVYGYMAEFFANHSKTPTISKIKFENSISSRGHNSISGNIFCVINGLEKFVTCLQGFFDDGPKLDVPKVKSKPATGSKLKGDKKSIAAQSALQLNQSEALQNRLRPFDYLHTKESIYSTAHKMHGSVVIDQMSMDEAIKLFHAEAMTERGNENVTVENDEQADKDSSLANELCMDCQRRGRINVAELYLSLLAAKLSSELAKCPLYQSIYDSYCKKEIESVTLPIPLVSLLKCGTESPGKLNMVKTVYLAPKPGASYFMAFQKLSAVHRELAQSLQQKLGANVKLTNNDGLYSPNFERPEQIFEFLQHACNLAGIDFEQEIDLVLDIGASYFYDEEKKKYEIATGNHKTVEDLISMYTDFVERYPVIGIIDGISFKDAESCHQLNKTMSEKCYCFGDVMFEESIDQLEDKIDEQQCFGAVLRFGSYFNNITELFQLASYIREKESGLIISNMTQQGCTSSLIPDVAVAVSAKFISCGAITHHENIQAFNRLIEIENELQASGKLKTADSHAFPVYKEAEVPEDTAIGGEEVKKIQSDMKEAS